MNALFNYFLESGICLAVFYLFYFAVLRQQPTFGYNRAYLLLTSLASLIIPLLEIPLYPSSATGIYDLNPGFSILILGETGVETTVSPTPTVNWLQVLVAVYLTGVSLTLLGFLKQLYQIRHIIKTYEKKYSPKGYRVIQTQGKLPVSSFFNTLFWDPTLNISEQHKQQVLAHEEVHISQKHSFDVVYMSLLKIVFWFNPFVYLYHKELTDVHEFAADAAVTRQKDASDYAKILVNQLFQQAEFSLLNHFYKSLTLKRLTMMKRTRKKIYTYRFLLALPLFALMIFVFSCQKEEDPVVGAEQIVETFATTQNEIDVVNDQINQLISKYPDFNLNLDKLGNIRLGQITIEAYKKAIEGVDNESDREKVAGLFIQLRDLNQELKSNGLQGADEVFTIVEEQPVPEEGMEAFYQYIRQNLKYPETARQQGIEGRVFVQFVVEKDGAITNVQVIKGIGEACDNEAVRVMQNATAWNPGYQRGRPVKVRMVLPISFSLGRGVTSETVSIDPTSQMKIQSTEKEGVVSGKVLDNDNNPLAGVNIIAKGTTTGTVSDMNGNYAIRLPVGANTLVFSFTGFNSKEIAVKNQVVINEVPE